VEVGLGGRFDATNVLLPELAVITMIGLDHTDRLGETVEEIAFEKAGVLKPRGRAVTGASEAALGVIEAAAREREVSLWRLGHEIRVERVRVSREETRFDLEVPGERYSDLRITLTGEHQARNAALAAASALRLRADGLLAFDEAALRAGLERARIAGRLQVVRRRPLVIVDGAHSPDRAEALALALRQLYLPEVRRVLLVLGCSQGHDPETIVRILAPLASEMIATQSGHPAAIPAGTVAAVARGLGVPTIEVTPVAEALREARSRAGEADLVVVTGSLFAAAEALAAIKSGLGEGAGESAPDVRPGKDPLRYASN
jgi:dihydrofolate synthase/folylpolyglutamate synthase